MPWRSTQYSYNKNTERNYKCRYKIYISFDALEDKNDRNDKNKNCVFTSRNEKKIIFPDETTYSIAQKKSKNVSTKEK